MKRHKKPEIFLVSLCLILPFLSCGKEQAVEEVLRHVRYVEVYSTGGGRLRTFSGSAKSGVESNLSFKVAGTINLIPVKVGDRVNKGQLIARLDPEDYQLATQQADAALAQAIAQQQKARADYERVRRLYENKNAAKSDLDAARASHESTKASVESAQKKLELARLQFSYTRLKAPSKGAIASVYLEVNENVQQGQTVVMMTAGAQIEVQLAIPEMLISQVKQGSSVTVKFDALPGKTYQATVREVGVAATEFATTYPVTARLTDADSSVRSGMAAEVSFEFGSGAENDRITVPSFAVAEDRDGRFVYVVEPVSGDTAKVSRIGVKIGDLTSAGIEILSGLSDGDLVVTAGVSKIEDGQLVKL